MVLHARLQLGSKQNRMDTSGALFSLSASLLAASCRVPLPDASKWKVAANIGGFGGIQLQYLQLLLASQSVSPFSRLLGMHTANVRHCDVIIRVIFHLSAKRLPVVL